MAINMRGRYPILDGYAVGTQILERYPHLREVALRNALRKACESARDAALFRAVGWSEVQIRPGTSKHTVYVKTLKARQREYSYLELGFVSRRTNFRQSEKALKPVREWEGLLDIVNGRPLGVCRI